ncbi:MAG TPA: hypothetical protein VIK74_01480, partial [Parasegetibacter sp.]
MRITISRLLAFFPISLFIFSVSPSFGQTINMVAGNMKVSCAAAPCGDGGLAISASLYTPSGMVIDANNNIYIAEFSNHAIRKIDAATGIISTVAGTQRSACGAAPCG